MARLSLQPPVLELQGQAAPLNSPFLRFLEPQNLTEPERRGCKEALNSLPRERPRFVSATRRHVGPPEWAGQTFLRVARRSQLRSVPRSKLASTPGSSQGLPTPSSGSADTQSFPQPRVLALAAARPALLRAWSRPGCPTWLSGLSGAQGSEVSAGLPSPERGCRPEREG